ncbi:DoxX family protein [Amycolatopsis albispora]|uniref:DoxX family protein n=1 Tax=Amycolatopsis albispora TaxID=1804986 RepID=A0A344KZJ6_9PSEU|nr:DoxX family protein [Amycolatopsis albispora]AXB41220.1 hypothetical protein A4R43_00735 [Amycolatopsis albispora]
MNLSLWIVAGVLAAVFVLSGIGKLVVPHGKLAGLRGAGWVNDFSPAFVKALGFFEVLGGAGLVLPAVTGVAPVLVPVAAVGLAIIMAGAATVMIRRREFGHMVANLVYLVLIVFVAWGRFAYPVG